MLANKLFFRPITRVFGIALLAIVAVACEKGYFPKPASPPPAKVGVETTSLEASYVSTAPLTLNDAYWKTADFLRVPVTALTTNSLYPNGYLNMTGTFDGLSSFNNGNDPKVLMKAAYDNNKVYIYIEWNDATVSPAFKASILNGPKDDRKADTTNQWTSQGNSDKVAIAFDIANATSAAGTFVDKGCAASCHQNSMQPQSGSVDIWSWDLATSDPLGYAADMKTDANSGLMEDAGNGLYGINKKTITNSRSEPAYEWDGVEQSVTRPDGKVVTLDPGYYLLNKTPFLGNYSVGKGVYLNAVYGCGHCHGDDGGGTGPVGSATAFASIGFARKYSRTTFKAFAGSDQHEGLSYWVQVPQANIDDLIAYIKGMGSVAGTYLNKTPTGSCADVWSVSNVSRSRIDVSKPHTLYSVLLVRNLTTPTSDDVQFTSPEGKSVPFGIALMNADGKNHIGSLKQMLTFKQK